MLRHLKRHKWEAHLKTRGAKLIMQKSIAGRDSAGRQLDHVVANIALARRIPTPH